MQAYDAHGRPVAPPPAQALQTQMTAQALQALPARPAPPPAPAQPEGPSIREVRLTIEEIDEAWRAVRQSIAGYNAALGLHRTAIDQIHPDDARQGPPLISFPASADGHTAEAAVLDVKHVPEQERPHLTIPMVHGFEAQFAAAFPQLLERLQRLRSLVLE